MNADEPALDWVAEEVPVALVYNGISHAVMMASPSMLEEFALGFSLSEGIIPDASHLYACEVREACRGGIEVDLTISSECFWKLKDRRRSMTGRTGCGICGVESLGEAVREKRVRAAPSRPSRWRPMPTPSAIWSVSSASAASRAAPTPPSGFVPTEALRAAPKTSAGMSRLTSARSSCPQGLA